MGDACQCTCFTSVFCYLMTLYQHQAAPPPRQGHSDCIISLRLPLHNKQYVVLLSIYAPTLQADPAEKDKFYTDLHCLTQKIPADDKIIILGDFNARVGKNWKGVLGKHGVGNCNDNGRLLLEFCAEQQLTITNTIFQKKDSLKTTWMHPRSKHWHLIDYVLVRQRDICDVCHTRVMPSAEGQTDHRLVQCKLNFHLKLKPRRGGIPRRRLQVNNLQTATVRDSFQANLHSRLEDHSIVASVGRALTKSSFAKPSHDDDDDTVSERQSSTQQYGVREVLQISPSRKTIVSSTKLNVPFRYTRPCL